ncbi:MAG: hypothetical protein M3302_08140 [Actinomycetota bacterium]|nr:hypothetical protein [Actinomycetota bacterium]
MIELIKALREQGAWRLTADAPMSPTSCCPHPAADNPAAGQLPPAGNVGCPQGGGGAGPEFSVAELSLVTGRSAVALLPDLDGALRAGLLAESPMGLNFLHELMRGSDLPRPHASATPRPASGGGEGL